MGKIIIRFIDKTLLILLTFHSISINTGGING